MSDSLIEQVKRLAEAQKCGALFEKLTRIETGVYVPTRFYFDFPALLAHMQAQQAVVDAAREVSEERKRIHKAGNGFNETATKVLDALTAALENLRSDNDGK